MALGTPKNDKRMRLLFVTPVHPNNIWSVKPTPNAQYSVLSSGKISFLVWSKEHIKSEVIKLKLSRLPPLLAARSYLGISPVPALLDWITDSHLHHRLPTSNQYNADLLSFELTG
jgi:hypothetical protein